MLEYAVKKIQQVAELIGIPVESAISCGQIGNFVDGVFLSHSTSQINAIGGGKISVDLWQVSIGGETSNEEFSLSDIGEPIRDINEAIRLYFAETIKSRIKTAVANAI